MREIALHLLDIAENSIAAESKNISLHRLYGLCTQLSG